MCTIVLILILKLLSQILKSNKRKEREKISPFECGFDPSHKIRNSFSLRFFVITLIFLVFDVEIAIILPLALSRNRDITITLQRHRIIFILLTAGLFFEWSQKGLEWI